MADSFSLGGMLEVGCTWPVSLEGAPQSATLHPLRASLPLADCSDSWSLPVTSQNLGQELWGQHKQQTQTSISKEGLSDRVESLKEQTERSQNQFLKKS